MAYLRSHRDEFSALYVAVPEPLPPEEDNEGYFRHVGSAALLLSITFLLDPAALHVGPHRVRLLLVHRMGKFLHQCLGESTGSPGQWESVAPQRGGQEHTTLKLQTPSGRQEGTIGW